MEHETVEVFENIGPPSMIISPRPGRVPVATANKSSRLKTTSAGGGLLLMIL